MTAFRAEIAAVSEIHGLDSTLVEALVQVESSGNQGAWNPEPHYRYFWNVKTQKPYRTTAAEALKKVPPLDFPCLIGDPDQEWWGQQVSWGLMQIMGAVARERGYDAPYLTQLVVSATDNLDVGCMHFRILLDLTSGNETRALAIYNGGYVGNAVPPYRTYAYASRVLKARDEIRKHRKYR